MSIKKGKQSHRSFRSKDAELLRELKSKNLDTLDEDELADLHRRVRRARAKHTKNYRRGGSKRVRKAGARGAARPGNVNAAQRAETFERALAKISGRLAAEAQRSADALRAERLTAARKHKGSPVVDGGVLGGDETTPDLRLDDRRPDTAARRKRNAGVKAAGARRQARKDSR